MDSGEVQMVGEKSSPAAGQLSDVQLSYLKDELAMSRTYMETMRTGLEDSRAQLQEARRKYYTVEIEKVAVLSELEAEKAKTEKLMREKAELQSLLEKRAADKTILENEIADLRHKLVTVSGNQLSDSIRIETMELREASLRQREARVEQETKIRDQRIAILEQEVDQLARQLTTAQRERTIGLCEMQATMEQKVAEVVRLKEELIHHQKILDQKDQHIAALTAELNQQQDAVKQLKNAYDLEIKALNQLVDAQKNLTSEERKKCDQLLEAITEFEKFRKTAEESHSQLEEALKKSASEYQERLSAKDKLIDDLEKEISDLRSEIASHSKEEYEMQLQSFFPAASTASRLIREKSSVASPEVSRTSEELEALRSENENLRTEIRKLVTEAEEKAPLFHCSVMEQKNTIEYLNEVTAQLASITAEKEEWDKEREALIQLSRQSARECERYTQTNEDLARQVQRLLHVNNELRGNTLMHQLSRREDPMQFANQSSANQVVSQHLVTFESIKELQQRNEQLLAALRSLSDEKDEQERQEKSRRNSGESGQLEKALQQLEQLTNERRDHMRKIDELVRQRDAIKLMLATLAPASANDSFNTSNVSASNTSTLESHAEYLSKRIEKLEAENEKTRSEKDSEIKQLNEKLLRANDDVNSAKLLQMTAESKLLAAEQKAEAVIRSLEEQRSAFDELQLMYDKLTIENRKHKTESKTKSDEITALKAEVQRNQKKIDSLLKELNSSKMNEKQLQLELDLLKQDNVRMSSLSETTKSLAAYVEKCQTDERRISAMENVRKELENENSRLRFEITGLQQQMEELRRSAAAELREVQIQLTSETEKNGDLTAQLTTMKREMEMMRKRLEESRIDTKPDLSKKVSELESTLKQTRDDLKKMSDAYDALRDKNNRNITVGQNLKTKLNAVSAELKKVSDEKAEETKKLTDALQTSQTSVEEHKAAADELKNKCEALERQLRDRPETGQSPDAAAQIAVFQSRIDTMAREIADLTSQKDLAESKLASAEEDSKKKMRDFAAQARTLINNLKTEVKQKSEEIQKKDEEMRTKDEKIDNMTREIESCECLRLKPLISQYENRVSRLENELQEANAQRNKKPVPSATASEPVAAPPIVPFCQAGPSSAPQVPQTASPLRHAAVMPTPQQVPPAPKGPPTASIRPLPHARATMPVVTISQPTIATVLPTQTAVGVVAPSTSSAEPSTAPVALEDPETSRPQVSQSVVPDEVDPHSSAHAPASPQPSTSSQPDPVPDQRPGLKRPHSSPEEGPDRTRVRVEEPVNSPAPEEAAAPDPDSSVSVLEAHQDVITLGDSEDEVQEQDSSERRIDCDEEGDGPEGADEAETPDGSDSGSEYSEETPSATRYADSGESDGNEEAMDTNTGENESQLEEVEVDVSAAESTGVSHEQVFAQPRDRSNMSRSVFFSQTHSVQVPNSYEDLGDGIVPRTPTLFVPRRDGTESQNSPCVPQSSFQFSSTPAQVMAESALGVERIDAAENQSQSPVPEGVVPDVSDEVVADETSQQSEREEQIIDVSSSPQRVEPDTGTESIDETPVQSDAVREDQSPSQEEQPSASTEVSQDQTSGTASQSTVRIRRPVVWENPPASTSSDTFCLTASAVEQQIEQQQQSAQSLGISSNIAQLQESIRGRQLRVRGASTQNRARRGQGWRGSRGSRGGRGGTATQ